MIKKDEMMYIPLLDSLQSLLRNEVVLTEVRSLNANTLYASNSCMCLNRFKGGTNPQTQLFETIAMGVYSTSIHFLPPILVHYRYFCILMMLRFVTLSGQRPKHISSAFFISIWEI